MNTEPARTRGDDPPLHLDHYGGARIPWKCTGGRGVELTMVCTAGPDAGRTRVVLDAAGGYASACLGAGHPVVRAAIDHSLAHDGIATDEIGSPVRDNLLAYLFGAEGIWSDRFPGAEYHVSGRNSGSEGMELALRLVQERAFDYRRMKRRAGWEDRNILLCFEGAWHGWTGGVRHLLNRRHFRVGLPELDRTGPQGCEVAFLPFGEVNSLRAFIDAHGHRLAAVIVEPVQGDAGILVPPVGYLRELARLCSEVGALVVADEVLTFAKTGQFFAMSDDGGPIATDITVIGKSVGMGALSQSMVIARRDLAIRPSGAVSSSDLRPLSCAVMRAGLDYIVDHGLIERSRVLGEALRTALRDRVVAPFPEFFAEVRGIGYLNAIQLTQVASQRLMDLRHEAMKAGIFVEIMAGAGHRSHGLPFLHPAMRIAPPLVTEAGTLDAMVDRIASAAAAVRSASGCP